MGVKYFAVDLGRLTVMLADDDLVAMSIAADALTGAGFKVVKATNGQHALQEALRRRVDLIIMDV
jgi:twitching motility two-component system response regulator PilH